MEKERKPPIDPIFRYPLFLLGLLILIVGGTLAIHFGVGANLGVGIVVVGFLFLAASLLLR